LDLKTTLLNKIGSRNAHVCILGLGYVGLPLAVEFARGENYVGDMPSKAVVGAFEAKGCP
jgi:UDP-N-acetyl-D-mannosaminuronate dehydrogenase